MHRRFALILVFLLVASCRTASQPSAPAYLACSFLDVVPQTSLNARIVIPGGGIKCKHGSLSKVENNVADVQVVTLVQSLIYGPDCNITFQVGSQQYVINAQQNFCEFKAGQVTAKVLSGNATVETAQGSYSDATSGTVTVTLK